MLRDGRSRFFSAALTAAFIAATAYGQSPEVQPANMETEVAGLKAENAALREQLRRVEEQQKQLLEVVKQRVPIQSAIGSYSAGFSGREPIAQLMFTF